MCIVSDGSAGTVRFDAKPLFCSALGGLVTGAAGCGWYSGMNRAKLSGIGIGIGMIMRLSHMSAGRVIGLISLLGISMYAISRLRAYI